MTFELPRSSASRRHRTAERAGFIDCRTRVARALEIVGTGSFNILNRYSDLIHINTEAFHIGLNPGLYETRIVRGRLSE